MYTSLEKKAHVFRLPVYLLDKLKELAQKDRRSLNNYVECLLEKSVQIDPCRREKIDPLVKIRLTPEKSWRRGSI